MSTSDNPHRPRAIYNPELESRQVERMLKELSLGAEALVLFIEGMAKSRDRLGFDDYRNPISRAYLRLVQTHATELTYTCRAFVARSNQIIKGGE